MTSKIKKFINNNRICVIFHTDDKSAMKLSNNITEILKKLNKFYKIKIPKIRIEFVYSRKELDEKLGCKTPKWFVAAQEKRNIYLFSPMMIEKGSDHKRSEMKKLLTHELCHISNKEINKRSLMWVDEGLALFFANQKKSNNFSERDLEYFAKNYFDKNISLKLFAKNNGYQISYWAIKIFIKQYGAKELVNLLRIKSGIKKRQSPFGDSDVA